MININFLSILFLVNLFIFSSIDLTELISYLLSSDIETLEEVSKMCGNKEEDGKVSPLVSVSDLKTLKMFETIILAQRVMPYKTELCPYYKLTENGIF